ncbi:plasma membrane fusion protein PRM1 [Saccharomyces cerevisiae]|nr:Prm1p [Saccharomyces cerevisiae YJM1460]CAI4744241.1 CEL_1a_G0044360.mRNA.1.CDS.1 [Saccharomyces cerevisiae]CAI6657689.1 CIC_HP1_G0041200.mRNA.1.CDS.1 [Saccharomyces cerevisiae]CAI7438315.1 CEL_1a_G0044360.mRNA.1.CDS.1 [Saccharomyces cerevisiae]GFP67136.1 plasma membrane fusion protein PRM1 [Saccharomyces cerevisiae]
MSGFKCYLQLGDRLSQIWLNKYTLVLLLAMLKLLFFSKSIQHAIEVSETYILSNCYSIDSLYSKMTDNTPHYLGIMGNYLIEKGMEETVKATLETLSLIVYASEGLVNFAIDLYLGTYACLIVSAVDGTVDVATNTTEKLISLVNDTVSSVANELDTGLNDISKIINKVIKAASKLENFFTGDDDDSNMTSSIKSVNLTISALHNLYIPSSINDKLEELSAKTPDFAQVKNTTKNLISVPFNEVRKNIKAVNASNIIGDTSVLYVPPVSLDNSTGICSSNQSEILAFYSILGQVLKIATVVCITVLICFAVGAMAPVAWNEIKLWRHLCGMRDHYMLSRQDSYTSFSSENTHELKDPFRDPPIQNGQYDVIASYQQCFQTWNTRIAGWMTNLVTFGKSPENIDPKTKQKIEWVVAYMTSERALCVLGIGLLGILVCICQFVMIALLKHKISHSLTSNDGDGVQNLLKSTTAVDIENQMSLWSVQTNKYINTTETNINQEVFGWINTTTLSVNNTVATMISDIDTTLADVFNGTLLYNPMKTVVGCAIENKLYTIEKAMTWIHDKAQLHIPRINGTQIKQALAKQADNSTIPTASSTSAATENLLENLVNDMREGLLKILRAYHRITLGELTVALVILAVWLVQLPIALVILRLRLRKATFD